MDIVETFQNHFGSGNASTHDFTLVEYRPNFFIGIDKFDHVCVVVKSSGLHRFPIKYKTQKISIECNMKVCYELNGNRMMTRFTLFGAYLKLNEKNIYFW